MDSVVLVMEPLTREMIDGGAAMVAGLDAAGFPPAAAYWVWTTDRPEWTLRLVYPAGDEAAYDAAADVCRTLAAGNPAFEDSWDADYKLIFPHFMPDDLTPALRAQALRPGPTGKPVRVRSVAGRAGTVDFALIYRLD